MRYGVLLILVFIVSCRVSIGLNGFESLDKTEQQHFTLWDESRTDASFDSVVYEVCSKDILKIASTTNYTWVHLWVPSCSGLTEVVDISSLYEEDSLGVILLSIDYEYDFILSQVENANYDEPVFVMSDSCFGSKNDKAGRILNQEINKNPNFPNRRYGEFLLKNGEVVFAGWEMTIGMMDSLISINDSIK